MKPYDLSEQGGMRGKYSKPTSGYDLNEVGGFRKRKFRPSGKSIEEKVKKIEFSAYDLNEVGGFRK